MGRGSSGLKRASSGGNAATTQNAQLKPTPSSVTPDSLVRLVRANSQNSAIRRGVYGLRDGSSDDVSDDDILSASIARTLKKADSPDGVAKIWFSNAQTRTEILNVLGNGYEFVEITNTTRGNLFGLAMRGKIKTWRLRKKQS